MKHDLAGMQSAVSAAQGKPDAMDWVSDRQAFALAYRGQLQESRVYSRAAMDLAEQAGHHERAAVFRTRAALWQALFGNPKQAQRDATEALALARNREVEYGAAVALATAGDVKGAQDIADSLEKRYPEDTSVRFNYVPVIRAILAIKRNKPQKAVEFLEASSPYELGVPRSAITWYFGAMYPIFFRGDAYLALNDGKQAAREYQKMLDRPGVILGDPLLALAQYRLAKAYGMSGDSAKARTAYDTFLKLWKDADKNNATLRDAQAEFARF